MYIVIISVQSTVCSLVWDAAMSYSFPGSFLYFYFMECGRPYFIDMSTEHYFNDVRVQGNFYIVDHYIS